MGLGLRHNDSLLNLSAFLEDHHDNHNAALEHLDQQSVGDSAEVALAGPENDEEKKDEENEKSAVVTSLKPEPATPTRVFPKTVAPKFSYDGYDDYYSYDPYAATHVPKPKKLLACLFPWLDKKEQSQDEGKSEETPAEHPAKSKPEEAKAVEPKEPQAKDPKKEEPSPEETPSTADSSLEGDKIATAILKGILKKPENNRISREADAVDETGKSRRALFNTMYVAPESNKADDVRKTVFSPMARVIMIDSYKNMKPSEKRGTWWQKSDYGDFKKSSRFVTRAMLQKGSEVWLMTNPSWGHNDKAPNSEEKDDGNSNDKWWCKFGHSRRGLEHITSPEEGLERQKNVYKSIAAVMNEQKRGRDADKIRKVYVRYNSWARELCLAAGASDAEAVRSNFRRGRCRDYYLSKSTVGDPTLLPGFIMKKRQVTVLNAQVVPRQKLRQTTEAIHDAPSVMRTVESMSKKAVGFGTEEHLNMSAALSGMGAVAS